MRLKIVATSYWQYLTETRHVQPDRTNYHSYLRVLRLWRSSQESLQLLRVMPKEMKNFATFQLVMSTIIRDKNNTHAFDNAEEVLDIMRDSLTFVHSSILEKYADLILYKPIKLPKVLDNPQAKEAAEKEEFKQKMMAMQRLSPWVHSLEQKLKFLDSVRRPTQEQYDEKESIIRLIKAVIGAHDSTLNDPILTKSEKRRFQQESASLNKVLQPIVNKPPLKGPKPSTKQPIIWYGAEGVIEEEKGHRRVRTRKLWTSDMEEARTKVFKTFETDERSRKVQAPRFPTSNYGGHRPESGYGNGWLPWEPPRWAR